MTILLYAGPLLVVLGIASLVVPIPHTETEGIKVGNTNFGVQTSHSERVSPTVPEQRGNDPQCFQFFLYSGAVEFFLHQHFADVFDI